MFRDEPFPHEIRIDRASYVAQHLATAAFDAVEGEDGAPHALKGMVKEFTVK